MLVIYGLFLILFQSDAAESDPVNIRVRISDAQEHVRISGFEFDCTRSRVRTFASSDLTNNENETQVISFPSHVIIRSETGFLEFGNHPYRHELWVYSRKGRCRLVNHLPIEKYLESLVNSEFSSKWNSEAVAAQVVAARTYALYQIKEAHRKSREFDVDSTVNDQVYDGSSKENYESSVIVDKTKGLILTFKNGGDPIKAFYHSTCGGSTELPEAVWGNKQTGFKRSVRCLYCAGSPVLYWDAEMALSEIEQVLKNSADSKLKLKLEKLVDLRIGPLNRSGRISYLTSVWRTRTKQDRKEWRIPAAKFREWIGPTRIRSTSFQLARPQAKSILADTKVVFKFHGRGNGHGVGLCQWGAKTMGEKGFKMAQILQYYYPDAVLRKVW